MDIYSVYNLHTVYGLTTFVVNIFLSIAVIFLQRKQPNSVYAWLLFIWLFPVIGFIFYILFSQKFSLRRIYRYSKNDNSNYNDKLKMQKREISLSPLQAFYDFGDFKDNIEYHINVSDALYTKNNRVEIFTDGKELFDQMKEDFRNAKKSINVEFYIINNDNLGNEIIDILEEKAKEGVEVRILYDEIGSNHVTKFVKKIRAAGGKIGPFLPSKLHFISRYFNTRLNYRNHRKNVVIDGKIGYIGGFNIGDEYLGLKKKFGYWRDTHLRIQGDAVKEMQWRFLSDWSTTGQENVVFNEIKEYPQFFPEDEAEDFGSTGIQIVASGPDMTNQVIKQGYIKMINDAKDNIRITSPYFVLDNSIDEALKIALNSGVKVEILIPNKPDHPFIYPTTLSYVGELIEYGAKVYRYLPGFVHSKVMTIDDSLSVVGSCNFDIRSFSLNFECSAFIYDRKVTQELNKYFNKDLEVSDHYSLGKYLNRDTNQKIKESLSRLLAPLL